MGPETMRPENEPTSTEDQEDALDLRALREAQREEGDAPTKSLEEVRKELGL